MTDSPENLLDAAQQAIRLERIDGDMRLLAHRVSSGMENVSNTLASVQVELRACNAKISELAGIQNAHDSNKVAIDKMERTVTDLRDTLEKWFDDITEKQDARWLRHEAENEDAQRTIGKEVQAVRDRVNYFGAFAAVFSVLGGLIVGMFLYGVNYRFNELRDDLKRIEALPAHNGSIEPRRIHDLARKS